MTDALKAEIFYKLPARLAPIPGPYQGDIGIDIAADIYEPMTLIPGRGAFIPGGFEIQFSPGVAGLVVGRSSTNRLGLLVMTGVIDNGYAGIIGAEVRNVTFDPITITPRQRIAQLIMIPATYPLLTGVETFTHSERGDAGWGSSGA